MKSRTTIVFALFIMLVAAASGRSDEPRRGPLGVFNWHQTETYPSLPWPTVPVETAKATCLVTDSTGKYPPSGTANAATNVVASVGYDRGVAAAVVGCSLVFGFLVLGGGGRLVQHYRSAHGKASKRK